MADMKYSIEVENIKCGGCAHTIKQKISQKHQVSAVEVDVDNGKVWFEAERDITEDIGATLKSLGYPQSGSVEGYDNVKAKAASFVSCAVGRMQKTS